MADSTHLDAVRIRRESLHQALVGLEDALSTPIGDGERWRLRVAMAVDHAANRLSEHVISTEADDGFLNEIVNDAPRLACRTARLRDDHEDLEKAIDGLRTALAEISDPDVGERGISIRNQALEFLGQLAAHRQRGADLIYEAYQVDIGNSS
ncbi:MAG: hypothetical protein GY724_20165 [Actinomycetia bacterium]|nr:hypothetical protein [Actinomycetes bacterium]MCP5033768.1 hypothetical protein [Actinomycetes bacterium]